MTVNGVEEPRETEADDGSGKERGKDQFLLPHDFSGRASQEIESEDYEEDATCERIFRLKRRSKREQLHLKITDQVSPNVARLRVDAKHGLETSPERVERGSVPLEEIIVVPQPRRQLAMVDDVPTGIPRLLQPVLCLGLGFGKERLPYFMSYLLCPLHWKI